MTDKREAELETENRMLRDQVASLEKIIEQISRPAVTTQWTTTPGAAAWPYYGQQWWSSAVAAAPGTAVQPASAVTVNGYPAQPA
jgi:hypothetical protein